jgi:iron complex outermembrane receptor protein
MIKLILLFSILSISGYSKVYKARIIDDMSQKYVSEVKVIIDYKDTTYSDKNGFIEWETNNLKVHIDLFKLSYKFEHYDIDLSKINDVFIIPIHPLDFHLHNIVVKGERQHSKLDSFIISSYKLDNKEFNSNIHSSIGESLQSIKGIDIRSMGSAPTRPVFRGLSNDRLKLNSDGFVNLDLSANSPDHNVTIDPQSVKSVSILRGPKTLKYSSSSSAGIIDLIKNDIPLNKIDDNNTDVKNYYLSNNNGFMNYIEHSRNLGDNFNVKAKASLINTGNINTPDKELLNSKISSENYSFGVAKLNEDNEYGVVYDYYSNNYGIPPGPKGTHPNGVNIEMFKNDLKFVYKHHFHDNNYIKEMKINYLYNFLDHNEYESSGVLGAKYIINNHSFRFDFEANNILFADNSEFGLSLSKNYFDAGAAVRTPEVNDYELDFYLIQSYIFDELDVDFAIRQGNKFYYTTKDASVSKISEFNDRTFNIKTVSLSTVYKNISNSNIGAILSYDERIPSLVELYSMGPHLASYSYDIGNQSLDVEKSINIELMYNNRFIYKELSIDNSINLYNYYFLNNISPRNTGKIDLVKTRLPIYENQGIEANMSGFEYQISLNYKSFKFINLVQYTLGHNLESKYYLPMIAPLKNIFEIKYKQDAYDISISSEFASKQDNIDEFETITDSYLIFHLKSNYYFYMFGSQNQLVFNIRNIFNTNYRNHLSRIKDIMPESGINFSIGLNNYF